MFIVDNQYALFHSTIIDGDFCDVDGDVCIKTENGYVILDNGLLIETYNIVTPLKTDYFSAKVDLSRKFRFDNLIQGDTFMYEDEPFIKISFNYGVSVFGGELVRFFGSEMILRCDINVTVKNV